MQIWKRNMTMSTVEKYLIFTSTKNSNRIKDILMRSNAEAKNFHKDWGNSHVRGFSKTTNKKHHIVCSKQNPCAQIWKRNIPLEKKHSGLCKKANFDRCNKANIHRVQEGSKYDLALDKNIENTTVTSGRMQQQWF